jgi:hypothetical protein
MASSTREFLRRMRVGFPPARRRLASPFHPSHVALVGVTTAVLAALLWLGADGVSTQAGAPGGVSGAAFWVKADSGLQVNGSSHVEQWLDQSGTANITTELRAAHPAHTNAILPSADILRIANGINFNPAVDFTGAVGKSLKGNAATEWDLTPLSIFAVAFREGALPADMAGVFTASVRWTGATTGSAGIGIAPTSAGYFLDGNGCFAGDDVLHRRAAGDSWDLCERCDRGRREHLAERRAGGERDWLRDGRDDFVRDRRPDRG